MEFFEQELVVRVTDETAFQSFLTKYNGVVVNDGALPAPPSSSLKTRVVPDRQWRLVRVKAPMVSLEELAQELAALGMQGDIRIPDQDTANLYALALDYAHTDGVKAELNLALKPQASGSALEHQRSPSVFRQPMNNWWLQAGAGNVIRAWEEFGTSGQGVGIAIIDVGFTPNDPDIINSDPLNGIGARRGVMQYDFAQNDYDVTSDAGGDPDPNGTTWHGHGTAAIAFGAQNNHYGETGVAPDATPMLFRVGRGIGNAMSYYDAGRAVDTAVAWGASVISMSFSANTPGGVGIPGTYLGAALDRAEARGVINVAAMGNSQNGEYYDFARWPWKTYPVPAVWSAVIAVGATNSINTRASYSNYGPVVGIWAPAGESNGADAIRVAPSNKYSSGCYSINFCMTTDETEIFPGTSAAAPFVAGAVALMKQVKPSLTKRDVLNIFSQTARKNTPDGNVNGAGLINVYEAVKLARDYTPPPPPPEVPEPPEICRPVSSC
ncbi:S8 family peptidase [Deinococcus aluminii]